ncbi:MAG: GNAT family N-acetyltransferase [Candidatus Diapherotrites archaeon]|nr:GNAT family N-acetyltransferase [Candidatus Diapherotrites archaeon]
MKIRNYQDNDFVSLIDLLRSCNLYNPQYDKREMIQRKSGADSDSIILAVQGTQIVGCIFFIYDPWSSFIYHLGVVPEHQNKGIATALLKEAEARLYKRGTNPVTLFVIKENKHGFNFFKKRGYGGEFLTWCFEKQEKKQDK